MPRSGGLMQSGAIALALFAWLSPGVAKSEGAEDVRVRAPAVSGFSSRSNVDDAPRPVTDAASLLEPMPGVHVRRMGGEDSFSTLSIRGSSSNQVTVFIAGVPLTGGADPTLDLATLPLWPGARARVFRSFTPPTLGAGSLGGSLSIEAPTVSASRTRTEVYAAGGSFGSARLRIGDLRSNVATALSATRSDDDFTYLDPIASSEGQDVFRKRTNAGHAAANGIVSYALPIPFGGSGEDGSLRVTALVQARDQKLPGTVKAPTIVQHAVSDRQLVAAELAVPRGEGALRVRLWARRQKFAVEQSRLEALQNLGPVRSSDTIIAAGTSFGLHGTPHPTIALDGRLEASAERYAPGQWVGAGTSSSLTPDGASRKTVALAFDSTWSPSATFRVGAGGRIDGNADSSASPRESDTALLLPTARLGAELDFAHVGIATHVGFLGRAPSFVERFGNRGAFIGEPDLKPESATTLDIGARTAKRFGALSLEAEAVAFATFAEDLIVFVNVGAYGRAKATNIGRADLAGAELSVSGESHGLRVRGSYTGLATRNRSTCEVSLGAGTACVSPNLPGRPVHDAVVDAAYALGPARLRYGLDVLSGMTADLTGSVTVPARVFHSAGVDLQVPRVPGLGIGIDVKNLFDLRVAEYAGVLGPVRAPVGDALEYPIPGRRFLLYVRFVHEGRGVPSRSRPL